MLVGREAQAAGTTIKDAATGRYLLVREATGDIELTAPGLGMITLKEGDSYKFADVVTDLRMQITNPTRRRSPGRLKSVTMKSSRASSPSRSAPQASSRARTRSPTWRKWLCLLLLMRF